MRTYYYVVGGDCSNTNYCAHKTFFDLLTYEAIHLYGEKKNLFSWNSVRLRLVLFITFSHSQKKKIILKVTIQIKF